MDFESLLSRAVHEAALDWPTRTRAAYYRARGNRTSTYDTVVDLIRANANGFNNAGDQSLEAIALRPLFRDHFPADVIARATVRVAQQRQAGTVGHRGTRW